MVSKNCGYITNNTKKIQKEKTEGVGLGETKRERENERDLFFPSLIKPAAMRQEKQKPQFFATSRSIVAES